LSVKTRVIKVLNRWQPLFSRGAPVAASTCDAARCVVPFSSKKQPPRTWKMYVS